MTRLSQKRRREIHRALVRLKERIARYDPNKGPSLETCAGWLLRRDELEGLLVNS